MALKKQPGCVSDGDEGLAGIRRRPGGRSARIYAAVIGATLAIRDEMFRETLRYSLQGCALFVLFAAILVPTAPASGGLHRAVRLLSTRALGRREFPQRCG